MELNLSGCLRDNDTVVQTAVGLAIRLACVDTSLAFSLAVSTGISFTLSEPRFSELYIGVLLSINLLIASRGGAGCMKSPEHDSCHIATSQ